MNKATLIGCLTAFLWALIPVLVVFATPAPPFLVTGCAFAIGWLGFLWMWHREGRSLIQMHVLAPLVALIGLIGLGGDTVLQVASLQMVPPVEANLIDATYPILTFIFAGLILKSRIAVQHVIGLLTAFVGVVLIVTDGDFDNLFAHIHTGHVLAMSSALILGLYASYQAYRDDITFDTTGAFFGYSAVLLLAVHTLFEPAYTPTFPQGLAIIGTGFALCGGFVCWYHGMNYGNAPVIAATSYSGHIISNLLLVTIGAQPMPPLLLVAAILILGGSLFAAKDDIAAGIKELRNTV
ncbi:MAG: DMT family transporter [Bdellovibrionales bacterium]